MSIKTTGNILTKSQIERQFSQALLHGHHKLYSANIAVNIQGDTECQQVASEYLRRVERHLAKLSSKRGLSAKDKITGIESTCRLILPQMQGLALVDLCIGNQKIIFSTGGSDGTITDQYHFSELCLATLQKALIDKRKDLRLTKAKLASVLRSLENIIEAVLAICTLTEHQPLQKFAQAA